MGWAHEGAVISSIATSVTWTRAAGLGGGGLESAAACWIDEVPGPTGAVPGPGSEVPGLASTVAFLESDPTSLGGAGTKIESDSGDGLIEGLRRRRRETQDDIAWRVEPIHAKASAWSLSFLGTWRNSHPSKYPLSCCTRKR